MYEKNENAVSPVVGVMLMLVVTIIIAAVVSAFAGGMGSSQDKTPQVTIKAEYSVADGMTLYHNGGDTLAVGDFQILLTPSSNMGMEDYVSVVNPQLISNGAGTDWYNYKGTAVVNRFASGDVAYINTTNCYTDKLTPFLIYKIGPNKANYGINQTKHVGSTFFLDFTTKDGKKITRVEVPIKP
ncbi:MAG: type IV pilin N-terminal domain-containing protein [Methanoregula sp.]|nr:type IV pilin N-terminal domain-containing protein [Methanoregula sp.]